MRAIACNTKGWLAAADDAVVASLPSPCYGELAMGPMKKSSAKPSIIDTLDGLHIMKVGLGPSHSLFICRNSTDKDREMLDKFQVLDQDD